MGIPFAVETVLSEYITLLNKHLPGEDGTLLNSRKKVSDRNLNSIIEIYKLGIPIIIATARPPRTVKELFPKELQKIEITVYYNGALIIYSPLQINEHYSI